MPKYFYKAISGKGGEENGVLEANDVYQLSQILRDKGLILVKAESERKKKKFEISLPGGDVPLTEKMFFTRNLRVMVTSGLPLPRSLSILSEQAKSKKFKKALSEINQEIQKGKTFSESLAKYPTIFSEFYQSMVRVGEESGTLEQVLRILTLHMERENELRSKIKGAMIYPAVIVVVMLAVGVLMMTNVVPQLAQIFKDFNIQLPLTTRIIISLTDFLTQKWYLAIAAVLVLMTLFILTIRSKKGKEIIDNITLRLPIFSTLIIKINAAYTLRTLSSLIRAGIPIVRSIEITAGTLGNVRYKNAMQVSAEKVRKGEKFSEALKPYQKIYPTIVFQMITVGEETGQTSDILSKLADFYEEEVSNATRNLSALIEPVLLVIIGVVVGFFAVSMIQPLYSMLGAIQ